MIALARAGQKPSALHNNCSGKHAGFLCGCRHMRVGHRGYTGPEHPWQETVRRALVEVTGAAHGETNRGIDGCSIPTYAVPLRNLALGFARMATGNGLGNDRAAAARRLLAACMAQPFHMSGTDKADLRMMRAVPGRVFVKTGAEGVYCGAVPELGLGIALKCDDGQGRAAEVVVAAVLAKLLQQDGGTLAVLAEPELRNWNGIRVGGLRPAEVLRVRG
jgi:L-asparaginase II